MAYIEYTSPNGYRGILYGKSSLVILDPQGHESLHTGKRGINTLDELAQMVDDYPEFIEGIHLANIWKSLKKREEEKNHD